MSTGLGCGSVETWTVNWLTRGRQDKRAGAPVLTRSGTWSAGLADHLGLYIYIEYILYTL
jgi:hypothetical protein